jgi:hypothetical protein
VAWRALGAHAPVVLLTAIAWAQGVSPDALGVAAVVPTPLALDDLPAALARVRGV